MTKDEALRLALEALEKTQLALARCIGPHKSEEGDRHRALAYSRTTITAIKAALEAKDEPVAWHYPDGSPEQCTTNKAYAEMDPPWTPMYYAPPKRAWVGLTKEERHTISMANRPYCADIMAAHEEELKRRNT